MVEKFQHVKKGDGLYVSEELANCGYPDVYLDVFVDENEENRFCTILNFGDMVVQYYFNLDRMGEESDVSSERNTFDIIQTNMKTKLTTRYKTIFTEKCVEDFDSDHEDETSCQA